MNSIILAKSKDWQGLYIDGDLLTEGINLDVNELCETYGIIEIEDGNNNYFVYNVKDDWLILEGSFPSRIEKILIKRRTEKPFYFYKNEVENE